MNPSRICFFAILSKDFRKSRSSDVLAILLIAYGHILPKLFEFFKLNIEIAQNIFDCFWDIAENMGVLAEKLLKIWVGFLFSAIFLRLRKDLFCGEFPGGSAGIKHSHPETHRPRIEWQRGVFNL